MAYVVIICWQFEDCQINQASVVVGDHYFQNSTFYFYYSGNIDTGGLSVNVC